MSKKNFYILIFLNFILYVVFLITKKDFFPYILYFSNITTFIFLRFLYTDFQENKSGTFNKTENIVLNLNKFIKIIKDQEEKIKILNSKINVLEEKSLNSTSRNKEFEVALDSTKKEVYSKLKTFAVTLKKNTSDIKKDSKKV